MFYEVFEEKSFANNATIAFYDLWEINFKEFGVLF